MIQRRIFIATMHCCGLFIDRVYCWGNEQLTKALGPFLELLWHLFESIGFVGLAELRSQSSR